MFTIEPERQGQEGAIESLLDEAFGADRHRKTSYRYRDGRAPVGALRHVAHEGPRLVGTIRHWPVLVGDHPALLLGPLGVAPDRQGIGIGRALIATSLARAAGHGHGLVLLVGDPAYYRPLGFEPAAPRGIVMPGEQPHRLMLRTLAPGALDGVKGEVRPWPIGSRAVVEPGEQRALERGHALVGGHGRR